MFKSRFKNLLLPHGLTSKPFMHFKDYYKILGLEPSASLAEIKKAYRKLALQLHPDKNDNDSYALAQFNEIKEAYEVLTNPSKKGYYLQQRWYNQSIGKRKTQNAITPFNILQQALELERYVSKLDTYRMDKQGLRDFIIELLPNSTIEQLKTFNEPDINREVISALIKSISSLSKNYTENITNQLIKLAGNDEMAIENISSFVNRQKNKQIREKFSTAFILLLTLVICFIIWIMSR